MSYWALNREVGHTHACVHGALESGATVLTAGRGEANLLKRKGTNAICVDDLELFATGSTRALVADHGAIEYLCRPLLKRLQALRGKVRVLEAQNRALLFTDIRVNELQKEVSRLKAENDRLMQYEWMYRDLCK